ncbi:MAG: hypothetical protein H6922_05185 [Pseudomonadaceae bacterium]|nr:hypothetical protein [Pseudomonadaceae bacterium]
MAVIDPLEGYHESVRRERLLPEKQEALGMFLISQFLDRFGSRGPEATSALVQAGVAGELPAHIFSVDVLYNLGFTRDNAVHWMGEIAKAQQAREAEGLAG